MNDHADEKAQAKWIEGVVTRYEGRLIRYAVGFTRDPETARDVVQETFLRLMAADRSSIEGHLAAWLYTVCRNRALDVLRKEGRMTTTSTTELERADTGPPPEMVTQIDDEHRSVLAAMERLPMQQREVVRLRFQGGLSYREISDVTGLSVSNVGYILHTALKKLRDRLTTEDSRPDRRAAEAQGGAT